ncbi:MAG: hypothetical protein HOY78_24885 [Saccharothrix sp.]|nr:hypothetical protein [Saccharothrix sp.]
MVICGVCGRRMDAHWVHGRPGYRCRHGRNSADPQSADTPKSVYWRDDRLLARMSETPIYRELASAHTSREVADLLRHHGLALLCDRSEITLIGNARLEHDGLAAGIAAIAGLDIVP